MATQTAAPARPVAQDDIERTASADPTVHRALIAVDPPMAGRDVADVQRAARERLEARDIDIVVPDHGRFTLATALACIEAQYFLGLRADTYLAKDEHGHRVLAEGAQRVLRDPESRDSQQLARAKARQAQVERGPRFYVELTQELGLTAKGPQAAIAYAQNQIGVRESAPNSGPLISKWISATGYTSPVPWCGCFVNVCIMAAGLPSGAGWIGYTPAIVARARAGTGGWSWHATGKPGDLILFDTPGGDPAVHVGLVEKPISSSSYQTIEGNTSSGSSGSQTRGDGVFRRVRSTQGSFRAIGFARPPYAS